MNRDELIEEAQARIALAIKARGGNLIKYLIFEEESRDGITVKATGVIFEDEFIPSWKLVGEDWGT